MIRKWIARKLRSGDAQNALRESKESAQQSQETLDRITDKAKRLDPKLDRLKANAERNHVVAGILSTFRVVDNGSH